MIVTNENRLFIWLDVTLDGVDVTADCIYADDKAGIVRVYKTDAPVILGDSRRPIVETKAGAVKITLQEDAPDVMIAEYARLNR